MDRIIFILSLFMFLEPFEPRPELGSVRGRICDAESGKAIAGALAVVGEDQYGAISDEKGRFVIGRIPPGEYSFRVEYRCYKPWNLYRVEVKPRATVTLNVGLTDRAQTLVRDTPGTGQRMVFYHPDDRRRRHR